MMNVNCIVPATLYRICNLKKEIEMNYVQKDGGSKGTVVKIARETSWHIILQRISDGTRYTVSKMDFNKHYLDEDGKKPKIEIIYGESDRKDAEQPKE
jgi:hypothetical protein